MATARVPLGRTVITRNAMGALELADVVKALGRHESGDWGESLCAEDRKANEEALRSGGRLISEYRDSGDVRFWVITEHDRSVTTVLLPEDY